MLSALGRMIIAYLTEPQAGCAPGMPTDITALEQTVRAGDVLLVRVSFPWKRGCALTL
jgi:hypothetical protein